MYCKFLFSVSLSKFMPFVPPVCHFLSLSCAANFHSLSISCVSFFITFNAEGVLQENPPPYKIITFGHQVAKFGTIVAYMHLNSESTN